MRDKPLFKNEKLNAKLQTMKTNPEEMEKILAELRENEPEIDLLNNPCYQDGGTYYQAELEQTNINVNSI